MQKTHKIFHTENAVRTTLNVTVWFAQGDFSLSVPPADSCRRCEAGTAIEKKRLIL